MGPLWNPEQSLCGEPVEGLAPKSEPLGPGQGLGIASNSLTLSPFPWTSLEYQLPGAPTSLGWGWFSVDYAGEVLSLRSQAFIEIHCIGPPAEQNAEKPRSKLGAWELLIVRVDPKEFMVKPWLLTLARTSDKIFIEMCWHPWWASGQMMHFQKIFLDCSSIWRHATYVFCGYLGGVGARKRKKLLKANCKCQGPNCSKLGKWKKRQGKKLT